MAPSLQTQDPSLFTLGTAGSAQSSETQSSSLLFKLGSMKPPKRPLRTVTPGDGFGVGKLGREEPDSGSKYAYQLVNGLYRWHKVFLVYVAII